MGALKIFPQVYHSNFGRRAREISPKGEEKREMGSLSSRGSLTSSLTFGRKTRIDLAGSSSGRSVAKSYHQRMRNMLRPRMKETKRDPGSLAARHLLRGEVEKLEGAKKGLSIFDLHVGGET